MRDRYNENFLSYYDLDNNKGNISFYLKYAREAHGEILELGCGTGRISIPLLQSGYKVTAVDNSKKMIDLLKQKLINHSYKKNIKLVHEDILEMDLRKKYDLIIMPFRVFQCFLTQSDQERALTNIKRHMQRGATLIFDVYFPNLQLLSDIPSREKIVSKYVVDGKHLIKTYKSLSIDICNQVVNTEIVFYQLQNNRRKLLTKNTICMRYSFLAEMKYLLGLNGLQIDKLLSDYKSDRFTPGKEMIFVCSQAH